LGLTLTGCRQEAPKPAEAEHHEEHGDEHADHEHAEGEPGHVKLAPDAVTRMGITTTPATIRSLPLIIETTAVLSYNTDRQAHVRVPVGGRVAQVRKTVGDRVRKGEVLAVLESPDLGQAQSDYLEAQARLDLARQTLQREERLFKTQVTAQKTVEQARQDARLAEIAVERTLNRFKVLGFHGTERLRRTRAIDTTLTVTAPIDGMILTRHFTIGEWVRPDEEQPGFTVADLSGLWALADIYEKDLGRVHVGQAAEVKVEAFPDRTFAGRVSLIAPALDPETRTAKARVAIVNAGGLLKPQMFGRVKLNVGRHQALAVPTAAVVGEHDEFFAFTQEEPGEYRQRHVRVGTASGGYFPVLEGLKAGDKVVTGGVFVLKSELAKGSFSEHQHCGGGSWGWGRSPSA
jgi:cobalt-zinc-cadmium efflux system membrane fusion protein